MDITIPINGIRLNIRTAVIIEIEIEIENWYIFEKDKRNRFYWVVGGRIKINENSIEAAKREIKEELGIELEKIDLKAIVESFFELDNENFHEICFYYTGKYVDKLELSENFFIFSKDEMEKINIQPKIIYDIINSKNSEIIHLIINEWKFKYINKAIFTSPNKR